jgi:hypothetical protein
MKRLLIIAFLFLTVTAFSQQNQNQYILIIRSKVPVKASQEAIKTNIDHWTAWMTDLGKNGKISGGYRPAEGGVILGDNGQTVKDGAYIVNGEEVSSFLIINAADMAEAKAIAAKCPVYELQGNVEIREIRNTAN